MKYSIITFGCQMNISDSERVSSFLKEKGYKKANKFEESDIIIVNICSIRQSAVDRVHGISSMLKRLNSKNILIGCFLEEDKKKFQKSFDFVVRTKDFPNLFEKKDFLKINLKESSFPSANIPIMTGCNNFCSYCVVPYVRGREYSRPLEEIIKEVKEMIKKGYKEVWLLGQNVNSYLDYKGRDFSFLLRKISNIRGDFWIRFTSSHPKDFIKEMILSMKKTKKITNYLNLPLQSGSDKILKKMNRPYSFTDYLKKVKELRKEIEDISITTDIIVGFPGETKKDFEQTKKAIEEIKFEMAYVSRYSERPGTKASKLKDNVPLEEKKRRERILNKIIEETSFNKNKKYLGKKLKVLITSSKKGYYFGKTENYKSVKVFSEEDIFGKFIKVKIIEATPWGLMGKMTK